MIDIDETTDVTAAMIDRFGIDAIIRSTRSPFTSGSPIYDVTVRQNDGKVQRLVAKDLAWSSMIPAARTVKDADSYDPSRESNMYEHVLRGLDLGTAGWLGTLKDARDQPRWLLLEWVCGTRLDQRALPAWVATAAWLGRLHAVADRANISALAPVQRLDRDWYMGWADKARRHLVDSPAWLARFDSVADHLSGLPNSLLHGDFSPANVIVAADRICPVDWERAAIGPAVIDLASLVSGWPQGPAERMIASYEREAGDDVDRTSLLLARLQLCVQWLGWARGNWQPPHQRRDWLDDADRFVREVGL